MSDVSRIHEVFSSIQGEGYFAGRRQIFIRFSGCNLDCLFCDTETEREETCHVETAPGSGEFLRLTQPVSIKLVMDTISEWTAKLPGAHHSISLTGGEPLIYADFLEYWIPELRAMLPIHLETNGTMHTALHQILPHIDHISMDIKLPSSSGCTESLWDIHRMFLETAITCSVSVKTVVAANTTDDEIIRACDIIAGVSRNVPLFIQPITMKDGRIGISSVKLLELQAIAASILPDVRIIPQMHKFLGVA